MITANSVSVIADLNGFFLTFLYPLCRHFDHIINHHYRHYKLCNHHRHHSVKDADSFQFDASPCFVIAIIIVMTIINVIAIIFNIIIIWRVVITIIIIFVGTISIGALVTRQRRLSSWRVEKILSSALTDVAHWALTE